MQVEGQAQAPDSQNEGQNIPAESSGASDIANTYFDEPETGQEEAQAAPEGEVVGEAEKKLQKNRARWDKILNERKQDKELIRSLQEKAQQFEGDDFKKLSSLRDLLRARPVYGDLLYHLLQGRDPQETVAELFKQEQKTAAAPQHRPVEEEYDPRTAAYFKEVEELKQWKKQQETERQAFMNEQVENYHKDIEHEYDRRLREDGFLDKDGKPADETFVNVLNNVMKAIVSGSSANPNLPTPAEFNKAYSTMKQCIDYMESRIRRDMSKKSVSDVPPLSGTSSGQMPIGKSKVSEHDRVMDIANAFG